MNRCACFALTCCLALAGAALADDEEPAVGLPLDLTRAGAAEAGGQAGRIRGTQVNLRAGPGTDHAVLLRFGGGNAVRILGREGAWVRVAHGGDRGWVHGDYVEGLTEAEREPPRVTPVGELVADSRLWGGMLASPGSPYHFRDVDLALRSTGGDVRAAVAPLLWPAGSDHAPDVLRLFVQGLNTPRPDAPGFMGGDARVRRYLAEGYLAAPLAVLYNGTARETTGEARREAAAIVARLAAAGQGRIFTPEEPEVPFLARAREGLADLAPVNRRDYVRAFRLRGSGFGAEGGYVNREVAGMAALLYAALRDPDGPQMEVTGYSDGTLIVEHGLKLTALRLIDELGEAATRERLGRVFLVYWGNATTPLVRGVRRLIVHDRSDVITTLRTPFLGRSLGGAASPADLPPGFERDAVFVTFETPWEGMNGHNALVAIGPALRAVMLRELGAAPGAAEAPRVSAEASPVRRLYDRLCRRGIHALHVPLDQLDVDWERYRPYLW